MSNYHISTEEGVSYTAAIVSILSSLTLSELAMLVGMATAIFTALVSAYFAHKKRQEEAREHELRVRMLCQHVNAKELCGINGDSK